jgi:putative spermidine/putrescine transport system permease protein
VYGPMAVIYVLSFQGREGGMTFPMNGVSTHWFVDLVSPGRAEDIPGSFRRSLLLAVIAGLLTVVLCVAAGWASADASVDRRSCSIPRSRAW